MHVLAVLSQKGGVGKTTLTVHLAVQAARGGLKVLLVDLDPQRSLAAWWRMRSADEPQLVETVPSRLSDILEAAKGEGIDLVVVDTAPSVSGDTARVAGLANLALIPLRPGVLDLLAIRTTADAVRTTPTAGLLVLNAVPAGRGETEAALTADARSALAGYGFPVAEVAIVDRRDFSRALNSGEAVGEFAPDSKAAVEVARLWDLVKERLRLAKRSRV